MISKKNIKYASTAAGLLYNLFSNDKKKSKNNDSSSSECSSESDTSSSSSYYSSSSEEQINFDKKKRCKKSKKKTKKKINSNCYYNMLDGPSGSENVENFNLSIKMNQIYYRLKDMYKVHQILSSSIRVQENIHDTKVIVRKNLKDISNILCKIRVLVKGKYYYKHYFNSYIKYFQLLVQQLNDNVDNNIVVIMKLDTIIQKWFKLHDIYYIQSRS